MGPGCLDESIPMDHVRGSRDLPYIATSKVLHETLLAMCMCNDSYDQI